MGDCRTQVRSLHGDIAPVGSRGHLESVVVGFDLSFDFGAIVGDACGCPQVSLSETHFQKRMGKA